MTTRSMTRRPVRHLSGVIRAAARIVAQELIAELYAQQEVERRLVRRYRCTPNVAGDIYREAMAELRAADDGDRENRMARMNAQIGRLFRKAEKEGRYSVCRQLLADVRRMQGIEGAIKVEDLRENTNELSERTDQELEYFKAKGHWPEEAPKTAAPQTGGKPSSNPLDRLVH